MQMFGTRFNKNKLNKSIQNTSEQNLIFWIRASNIWVSYRTTSRSSEDIFSLHIRILTELNLPLIDLNLIKFPRIKIKTVWNICLFNSLFDGMDVFFIVWQPFIRKFFLKLLQIRSEFVIFLTIIVRIIRNKLGQFVKFMHLTFRKTK